jgi:hypothetical protein
MLLLAVRQRLGGESLRDLSQACKQLLLSGDNRKAPLLILWLGCESFAQRWDGDAVDDQKLSGVGERLVDAARKALDRPTLESIGFLAGVLSNVLATDYSAS